MRDLSRDMPLAELTRPAPAAPLLELRDVSLSVGGARRLHQISLGIAKNRLTVVLGANGAGKTLLLRLMHGLESPEAGGVFWQTRPLDRGARRAQAMVFQRPVMLRRSVRANLRFALGVQGLRGKARAAAEAEALEWARLTHLADQPARRLSGGEQQRLAIARALASGPELLLLDEPTAQLDPASTLAVEDLIGLALARGVSVVLVTHDGGQARRLGQEAVFLHAGRVVETGPALTVLERPQSAAARAWRDGQIYLGPDGADSTSL